MAVHLQIGKQNNVAVVFSCPGRHEEIAGYPAAKTTGNNLNKLLSLLSDALGRSNLTRSNITITNAWPSVEYKEKTGRSEATEKEVVVPNNLNRLEQELSDITEFVIFFGDIADATSHKLELAKKPRFINVEHLSTRGLLSIRNDVHGKPIVAAKDQIISGRKMGLRKIQAENTERRLVVVVSLVLKQLQDDVART